MSCFPNAVLPLALVSNQHPLWFASASSRGDLRPEYFEETMLFPSPILFSQLNEFVLTQASFSATYLLPARMGFAESE